MANSSYSKSNINSGGLTASKSPTPGTFVSAKFASASPSESGVASPEKTTTLTSVPLRTDSQSLSQTETQTVITPAPKPVRRRGTVACGRCRRLRSRCVHDHPGPPCQACKLAGGLVEAQCAFPKRGEKDVDRQFRRRMTTVNTVQRTVTIGQITPAVYAASSSGPVPEASAIESAPRANTSATEPEPATTEKSRPASRENHRLSNTSPNEHTMTSSFVASIVPSIPRSLDQYSQTNIHSVLPPIDEVVEGCRIFVTSYFQLGFVPKSVFLERLMRSFKTVSTFLLCCILCISARFTPKLVERYGGARQATDYFVEASRQMVPTEMYQPSLERIQGFFLLAISQWGNGDKERSSMDMGIAVRMAALLKLHCEESYALPANATAERVVQAESARRTFWMIQSQENLHSGYKTPAPFPLEDITTLLPCDEKDFAFGDVPAERAAMAGTPPGISNPSLIYSPRRCLFATLIQVHGLWGKVARRACRTDYNINKAPPWDPPSEYARTIAELDQWETSLPSNHCFSVWNLRGWKSESLHLAYLAVTMVIRLSHIVSRRIYLDDMLLALTSSPPDQNLPTSTPSMAPDADEPVHHIPAVSVRESYPDAPAGFWAQMSAELFSNVHSLHEQIDAFFAMRTPEEGFPQILVFCVYMCGSLASYLWRSPALCPELASRAETMANRALEVLSELHPAWPMSSKWQKGLQQIATPLNSKNAIPGPRQSHAPPPDAQRPDRESQHRPTVGGTPYRNTDTAAISTYQQQPQPQFQAASRQRNPSMASGVHTHYPYDPRANNSQGVHAFPNELFDAELTAFLQGDFQFESFDSSWGGTASTLDNHEK